MSKLTRKTLILAVIETVIGTDAVPTAALNAILQRNCTYTPTGEFASRDVMRPYLGNSEQLPTAIHGQIDFEHELAGSGAAGTSPAWGVLMQACGFAETITA